MFVHCKRHGPQHYANRVNLRFLLGGQVCQQCVTANGHNDQLNVVQLSAMPAQQ